MISSTKDYISVATTALFAAFMMVGCGLEKNKIQVQGINTHLECSAFSSFQSQVHPVIQASCVSCHASGSGGLTLNSDVQASYTQAKQRLDLTGDVTQSKLLLKAQGLLSHGGGTVLASDSDGFSKLSAWAFAEQTCLHPSGLPYSIRIQPNSLTLEAGTTLQLQAYGNFSNGEHQLTGGVIWSSSDASVLAIDGTGKIHALKNGQSTVTAMVIGGDTASVSGSTKIEVSAATLQSVKVTPTSPSLLMGSKLSFTATATYSDGTSSKLNSGVQWSSSSSNVATIDADGVAHALISGSTTISANFGGFSDQSILTVTQAPILTSISIDPLSMSIEIGKTAQASVRGTYSDGSIQTLTQGIVWSSADALVASVDSNGIVTGMKVAATTIAASVSGKTASAKVTVIKTAPTSIAVSPNQIYVETGKGVAMKATANFSDGSQTDVTALANWAVSDPALASYSSGTLQALKKGILTVTATYGSKSGTSALTLLDCPASGTFSTKVIPVLKDHSCVSCHSTSLASGGFNGSYSSSTSRIDLTKPANSLLLRKPTASVSHSGGKLFDVNSAPYQDIVDWIVEEHACVSLQSITNKSLSIRPNGDLTLKIGESSKLSAIILRSDGSELDVTTQSTWSSSKASVATVSAAGMVTPVAAGTSVISAKYGTFTDQINLTVSPATLLSISLDKSAVNLSVGGSQGLIAKGNYSDGTSKDVSATAVWVSSKPTIADVSAGLITAKAVGSSDITASVGAVTSPKSTVTVSASGSLELIPGDFSVAVGSKLQLQLFYNAPDHSRTLVSSGMSFRSSAELIASVDTKGLVSAKKSGTSILTASYNSLTVAINLAVLDCPSKANFSANVASIFSSSCVNCHSPGSASGGFAGDYDTSYARINLAANLKDTDSLLLRKPTAAVSHGGGAIFDTSSSNYKKIIGWIDLERQCAALPAPVLEGISPTLTPTSVRVAETSVPKAIATYSDLSTKDVTSMATWSVDDPSIASYATGKLTGLKEGAAIVTASIHGIKSSANLKVSGAKLTQIILSPTSATIEAGHSQSFVANGKYSDGKQSDITSTVSWSVSDKQFASVASGVVSGIAKTASPQTLSASLQGVTGLAKFTVYEPTVKSTVLNPTSAKISSGQAVQFTLTEKLSDGTDRDVSTKATWKSSVEQFVAIDSTGYASAKAPGSVTITATYLTKKYTATLAVSPAALQSLTIDPITAYLKIKDTLDFTATAHYSDGTSSTITNGANWTSSDPSIVSPTSQGSIVALKTGSAKISVSSETLSASATVDVPVCSTSGKVTITFKNKVQSTFEGKCVGCHGDSKNHAFGEFPIIKNPTAAQLQTNYSKSLAFVDIKESDSIDQSLILSKSLGKDSHGGGLIFKTSDDGFKSLYTWAMEEKACSSSGAVADGLATNLARSSGPVLQLRLQKLFQDAGSTAILPDADFDAMDAKGLNIALGSTDRFTTANAQIALRLKTTQLCSLPLGSRAGEIFSTDSDLLMHGESFPTDEATKLAFTAARRAWLAPYKATDKEVLRLAKLYTDITKISSAAEGKKAVCMAALASPAFWLGNRGPEDVIRRIALEIGRILPTFADYEAFKNSTDKNSYLRGYLQKLQSDTNGGYYQAINDWFRVQLGLRGTRSLARYPSMNLVTKVNAPLNFGLQGNSELGGMTFVPSGTVNGSPLLNFAEPLDTFRYTDLSEEVCNTSKTQAFDPVTSRVMWEQFNPDFNEWETIAEWKDGKELSSDQFTNGNPVRKVDGSKDGLKIKTSLADITINNQSTDKDHLGTYHVLSGALVGTAMEYYKPNQRKVHRYGHDGAEQDGVDAVNLWFSGQKAYVCNSAARYYASCFYRPSGKANYPIIPYYASTWNASIPKPVQFWRSSILNPGILENMRCGTPSTSELSKTSGYDDQKAYPSGSLGSVNTYASNISLPAHLNGQPEEAAIQQIVDDMDNEPYRLINHLLQSNGDFRELVTAKYTFVHSPTESFYRSQGYFLPTQAPGFSGPGDGKLHILNETDLPSIPFSWLRNNRSDVTSAAENFTHGSVPALHVLDKSMPTAIPHRVFSGILTQPAFFSAAAPKMRTLSDRVFERLMCGKPSLFVPDSHQQGVQAQFVPITEANGKQHVKPGSSCYSCHINMDPLASALSASFFTHVGNQQPAYTNLYEAVGEMFPYVPSPGDMPIFNVQNGMGEKGKGALLGVEVEGVEGVAQVLSRSNEFAKCMVQTAFTNIFGREPTDKDVDFIGQQAVIFQGGGYNYNKMIEEMVASPTFQEQN